MDKSKNKGLISIIIPIYNVAEYLGTCLESIESQTYQNFEVIMIDDGSKDESGAIMDQWVEKHENFHGIHQQNGGVSVARNTGMKVAQGEYMTFIDPDDYVLPECLQLMVDQMANDDCQLSIVGLVKKIGDQPRLVAFPTQDGVFDHVTISAMVHQSRGNTAYIMGKLYLTELILEHKIYFDSSLAFGEDTLFLTQYLLHVQKGAIKNQAGYVYLVRADSATNAKEKASDYDRRFDSAFAAYKLVNQAVEKEPELVKNSALENQLTVTNDLIRIMNRYGVKTATYQQTLRYLRQNRSRFLGFSFVPFVSRLKYVVSVTSPGFSNWLKRG